MRSWKDILEELEIISWSQNCVLVDKIEDMDKRVWYAKQIIENGWSKIVLSHQIDLELLELDIVDTKKLEDEIKQFKIIRGKLKI